MGKLINFKTNADMREQSDAASGACLAQAAQGFRSHVDLSVGQLSAILENCERMLALLDKPIDHFSTSSVKADLESRRASIALSIRAARSALAEV